MHQQPGDGRKIPRNMENPFDNLVIDICTLINRSVNQPAWLHPNHVTAASLVTGVLAAHFAFGGRFLQSSFFVLFSYFLDCMDGNYARMYGMSTEFGDWFDHISDVTKYVLLYTAVLLTPALKSTFKVAFIVVATALMLTTAVHLGCQEQAYEKRHTDSLSMLEPLCPSPSAIYYTKYLGMGTWVLSLVLMLFYAGCLQQAGKPMVTPTKN